MTSGLAGAVPGRAPLRRRARAEAPASPVGAPHGSSAGRVNAIATDRSGLAGGAQRRGQDLPRTSEERPLEIVRTRAATAVRAAVRRVRALPSSWFHAAVYAGFVGVLFLAVGVVGAMSGHGVEAASAPVIVGSMGVAAACSIVTAGVILGGLKGGGWYASTSVFTTAITAGTFTSVAWDGTGSMVGLAFVPATVGTWCAAVWTRRLYDSGIRGAELVEATTTVRGLAFAWALIMSLVLVSWIVSLFGTELSVDSVLGDGLAGLVGVAATVAYAGGGYTEYRRAIDVQLQRRRTRARNMRASRTL